MLCSQVELRACTGPIVVDVNNLLQQVYVYGSMVWQGSIKFINSFPSPRRGGLFSLVSVLSVEGDGVVEFKVCGRQWAMYSAAYVASDVAFGEHWFLSCTQKQTHHMDGTLLCM